MSRPEKWETDERISINTGIILDKLHGPWAVDLIRIWLDYKPGEWVVERQIDSAFDTWEEVARFDTERDEPACPHGWIKDGTGQEKCMTCGVAAPWATGTPAKPPNSTP